MNTRLFPRELVEAAAEYHVGREDDVEAAKSYIKLLEQTVIDQGNIESKTDDALRHLDNLTTNLAASHPASQGVITESGYVITNDKGTIHITRPGVG